MQRIGFYFALARSVAGSASCTSASCPGFSAVQLGKELLFNNAPLISTQPICEVDTCKIIGDPHVTRFDRKWMSLLETNEQDAQAPTGMVAGTYFVYNDGNINIQATFGGNGPLLTELAIGGPAVANNFSVIIIRPENGGEPFQTAKEGTGLFELFGDGDTEYAGVGYTAYKQDVPLVLRSETEKQTPGYAFVFNAGDPENYMRIIVNRRQKSLNVAISRCQDASGGYHEHVETKLGDDVAIGMCGTNDPGTTIEPNATLAPQDNVCDSGTCNVYGDPHITSFDRRWMSLFQLEGQGHMERQHTTQRPGDFWLVQSDLVKIQARFGRNGPMMTHVAVGGDIMKGNVLVIGAQKDAASWNGKPIMTSYPSTFESDDGIVRMTYSDQTSLVQRKDGVHRNVPGVSVTLPNNVELIVNRMARSINLAITMCEATVKIGGYCGNLQVGDDLMLDQDHSPYEVPGAQSLFRKADDLKNRLAA